jgi:NAD(P)-dependent dehydrogenase (short-subunit alcohol dehydrogenase family)
MNNSKTWFVTGASKGLGLTLVKKLLASGYRVAATSRNINSLVKELGEQAPNFLPLQVDLVNESSVQRGIENAIAHFGRIDIVVNNAGYGLIGALEELTDAESRGNFDVNVFGVLNVIRKVIPHLRSQKSGHIFNIASIGAYSGAFPGWGIYCATKFAVAGLTESLAEEIKPFGIYATVVYPGYFRTNFLAEDSINVPAQPIDDYQAAHESQRQHQAEINGNQPGDPEKAADVLISMSEAENAPVHLFLGRDAYGLVTVKNAVIQKDMEAWQAQATATDINT